jgi:hypothetical protein
VEEWKDGTAKRTGMMEYSNSGRMEGGKTGRKTEDWNTGRMEGWKTELLLT